MSVKERWIKKNEQNIVLYDKIYWIENPSIRLTSQVKCILKLQTLKLPLIIANFNYFGKLIGLIEIMNAYEKCKK